MALKKEYVPKGFLNQEYSVSQAGADVKEGTQRSRRGRFFIGSFFTFAILLSIGMVAFSIVFFLSTVDGSSMMQTLNAYYTPEHPVYDNVLVNKYATPRGPSVTPHRDGDIIVVRHYWPIGKYEDENGKYDYFIKRLFGLAGDRIYFNQYDTSGNLTHDAELTDTAGDYTYKLVINDTEIVEDYLDPHWGIMRYYGDEIYRYLNTDSKNAYKAPPNGTPFSEFIETIDGKRQIVIPEGYIFFMGDNRGSDNAADFALHSHDCTAFGPQPITLLEGVVADIIPEGESMPAYVWRKIREFFSFKWI